MKRNGHVCTTDRSGVSAGRAIRLLGALAAASALLFLAGAEHAQGQASFQGLGVLPSAHTSIYTSYPTSVSSDGRVVVGGSSGLAFRWTQETGISSLGSLPASYPVSIANAVSADGSVIGGNSQSITDGWKRGFRWESGVIAQVGTWQDVTGLSSDGLVMVGQDNSPAVPGVPSGGIFRWTPGTLFKSIGLPSGHIHGGNSRGISADGTYIAATFDNQAFRWMLTDPANGGGFFLPLGDLSAYNQSSTALAISADGQTVVGSSVNTSGNTEACRWTLQAGVQTNIIGLGFMPGGTSSFANGVSGDGNFVVGESSSNPNFQYPAAVIWDAQHGMRVLRDVLQNDYGLDLSAWNLSRATGVSFDGSVIAGEGYHNGFPEGWIVQLAGPPTPAGDAVKAWGRGDSGQLGDGTYMNSPLPVSVQNLRGIKQIASGVYHTLALRQDGTVWAWGYNGSGQLGIGDTGPGSSATPVQVRGPDGVGYLTGIVAIDCGAYHSLAVRTDGTVWAWGYNHDSQLGDGTTVSRTTPVQVSKLTGVIAVAGGGFNDLSHSLAVKSDGTVWAWGLNRHGEIGDGTAGNTRSTPVKVANLTSVASISAGGGFSLALKKDGTVWSWGFNISGVLGDGTTTDRKLPVRVTNLSGVKAIAAGSVHCLAIKADGTVWAWGNGSVGQLGNASLLQSHTPVQTKGLTGVTAIEAGPDHSLAVKSDGTAWAWGNNDYGQLGNGTAGGYSWTPVRVSGLTGEFALTGGWHFSVAIVKLPQ